tara:strand:- start:35 stop:307 length:273 start_codon:yes stop_codon:yes gene_type:complete
MKYTFASLVSYESFVATFGGSIFYIIAFLAFLASFAITFNIRISFLGQTITRSLTDQLRQKIIIVENLFDGNFDYSDMSSNSIIHIISND